jgi:hypothetical protein
MINRPQGYAPRARHVPLCYEENRATPLVPQIDVCWITLSL